MVWLLGIGGGLALMVTAVIYAALVTGARADEAWDTARREAMRWHVLGLEEAQRWRAAPVEVEINLEADSVAEVGAKLDGWPVGEKA